MPARSRGHAQSKSMLCGRGEGTGPASAVPVPGLMAAHGRQQLHSRASTPADGTLSHDPPPSSHGPAVCSGGAVAVLCVTGCAVLTFYVLVTMVLPSQAARTSRYARICEGAHTTHPERPLPTREQYSSPADVVACSRPTNRSHAKVGHKGS